MRIFNFYNAIYALQFAVAYGNIVRVTGGNIMVSKKAKILWAILISFVVLCIVAVVLVVVLKKDDGKTQHHLIMHEAELPTCTEAGVDKYWECLDCQKLFADKNAKIEIQTPPELSALGHDFNDVTYACSRCNETNATEGLTFKKEEIETLAFCTLDGVTGVPETLVLPYSFEGALLRSLGEGKIPNGVRNIVIPASELIYFESNALPDSIEAIYYLGDVNDWASYSFVTDLGLEWIDQSTPHSFYLLNEEKTGWKKVEELVLNGKTVENGAFMGFDFTSVKLLENVQRVNVSSFANCSQLENLDLGTINIIGRNSFAGCAKLKTIRFSPNISSLNLYAFIGCNAVETVYYSGTAEQWQSIVWGIGNNSVKNAQVIYDE